MRRVRNIQTYVAVRGSYRLTTTPERQTPMFGINLKHSLAAVAVAAGVLAAAGPASARTESVYQHNQTDVEWLASSHRGPGAEGFWLGSNDALGVAVTDGTSNTIMFGARAAASPAVFSADAYDNEMGLLAARLFPDVDDEVL